MLLYPTFTLIYILVSNIYTDIYFNIYFHEFYKIKIMMHKTKKVMLVLCLSELLLFI